MKKSKIKTILFVMTSPIWILALAYCFNQVKTIGHKFIVNELNQFNPSTQLTMIIATLVLLIIALITTTKIPSKNKKGA